MKRKLKSCQRFVAKSLENHGSLRNADIHLQKDGISEYGGIVRKAKEELSKYRSEELPAFTEDEEGNLIPFPDEDELYEFPLEFGFAITKHGVPSKATCIGSLTEIPHSEEYEKCVTEFRAEAFGGFVHFHPNGILLPSANDIYSLIKKNEDIIGIITHKQIAIYQKKVLMIDADVKQFNNIRKELTEKDYPPKMIYTEFNKDEPFDPSNSDEYPIWNPESLEKINREAKKLLGKFFDIEIINLE